MIERIISVAIRIYSPDGRELYVSLPPPARHGTVLHSLYDINHVIVQPDDQGFLTSNGRFVGRVEAVEIAFAAGQITKLISPPDLYSEDLW